MSIHELLAHVDWKPTGQTRSDDLPVATHQGVFHIGGLQLRCYRLDDGSAIFNAEDLAPFLDALTKDQP